jgi:hypothetical protein
MMKPGKPKQNVRAAFRDKRYTIPVLLIDVFEKVFETRLWSLSQLILPEYEGGLQKDAIFTGAFNFEDRPGETGLFEAKVARLDPVKQLLGAAFTWVSKPGAALLEGVNAERKPDAPPGSAPKLRVTLTHRTINWSLSGCLLDQYYGGLKDGEAFNGLIRIEKAQESGTFTGAVIRANHERHTLAVKFHTLSPDTFELLEVGMKKSQQA